MSVRDPPSPPARVYCSHTGTRSARDRYAFRQPLPAESGAWVWFPGRGPAVHGPQGEWRLMVPLRVYALSRVLARLWYDARADEDARHYRGMCVLGALGDAGAVTVAAAMEALDAPTAAAAAVAAVLARPVDVAAGDWLVTARRASPLPADALAAPLPAESGAWVQAPRGDGPTEAMWRLRVPRAAYNDAFALAQHLLGGHPDQRVQVIRGLVLRALLAPYREALAAIERAIGAEDGRVARETAEALLAPTPDEVRPLGDVVRAWGLAHGGAPR